MAKSKLPRTTKRSKTQTGKSNRKSDVKKKAMPPGKRLSKNNKPYTEKRANRSDKSQKKRL